MVRNVCSPADKTFRIVIGILLLSMLFLVPGSWSYLGLLGLIPLATVVMGYCPVSQMLGINTCKLKHSSA